MKKKKTSKSTLIILGLFGFISIFSLAASSSFAKWGVNQQGLLEKQQGGYEQCGENCYYSFTRGCVCWKK